MDKRRDQIEFDQGRRQQVFQPIQRTLQELRQWEEWEGTEREVLDLPRERRSSIWWARRVFSEGEDDEKEGKGELFPEE